MNHRVETRIIWQRPIIEVRSTSGGREKITGLAIPYNELSIDLDGFREIVRPGAFARTLAGDDDVRADVEHDRNVKLARRKNGSLKLIDLPRGLAVEILLPNTTVGRNTAEEIRAGLLDGMSIGMIVEKDEYVTQKSGELVRGIRQAKLTTVALTQFPAYPQTIGTVAVGIYEWDQSPVSIKRKKLDLLELV